MNLPTFLILTAALFCLFVPIVAFARKDLTSGPGTRLARAFANTNLPWKHFLLVILMAQITIFAIPGAGFTGIIPDLMRATFAVLAPVLSIAVVVSCFRSRHPTPLKIAWICVAFAAPVFGPVLWFRWGKSQP